MSKTNAAVVAVLLCSLGLAPSAGATAPGANGRIALERASQIWTINPGGTGLVQLTSQDLNVTPAWSPDGTKIAWAQGVDANHLSIWVMDADGSHKARLTSPGTETNDTEPAWSPDGSKIALVRGPSVANSCTELWVMNADGTGQVQLAPTPDCREADLDWSSADRLAYTSEPTDHFFPQVYVANADNTGTEQIAAPARAPNWSPGGLWLAFVTDIFNPTVNKTSMDPSRANRELGRGQTPEWSPEGDRIAISGTPLPGSESGVWNMPEVGGVPALVTPGATNPDWQPLPPPPPEPRQARPKGATPIFASLVPAFVPCTSPNRQHGAPLSFGSCGPPVQASDYLTVGTADSNGNPTNSVGSVQLNVIAGDPETAADEADVVIATKITDVRCKVQLAPCTNGALSDYTGTIEPVLTFNFTDSYNGGTGNESATGAPPVFQPPFHVVVPCAATADAGVGSTCSLATSVDALVSGAVKEGKRAVWELAQIRVLDGGSDGSAANDERTTFATQGLFAP